MKTKSRANRPESPQRRAKRLCSREARKLASAMLREVWPDHPAPATVHAIVGSVADYVAHHHGDPMDWSKLDVGRLFAGLVGPDFVIEPEMALLYATTLVNFYAWLADRGKIDDAVANGIIDAINEHRDAFVGRAFVAHQMHGWRCDCGCVLCDWGDNAECQEPDTPLPSVPQSSLN
jgi:hypothetical protein